MIHRPRMITNSSSEHRPKFKLAAVQNRSQIYKVKYYGIKACQKNKLSSLNLLVIELAQFFFFNEQCLLAKARESGAKSSLLISTQASLKYHRVYCSLKFIFAWFLLHVSWQSIASKSTFFLQYDIWTLEQPLFLMGAAGRKQFGITLV